MGVETRYVTGTTPTTFRYTGQRQESGLGGANGLYDYGARWLDPHVGRWLQADSIVPEPGNPQALNRYSYSFNNPVKYTDPTGHKPCELVCPGDWVNPFEALFGSAWYGSWDVEQQQANAALAESVVVGAAETAAAVLWEPADWALTARDCASGQCSAWALAGVLPLIPSSLGRYVDDVIPVFRVEGLPNTRLHISDAGDVTIVGPQRLHLNFGDPARALELYQLRVSQGLPDAQLKAFDVDPQLLDLTQQSAVPQALGQLFPRAPQIVDATKAANQFGFPARWFPAVRTGHWPSRTPWGQGPWGGVACGSGSCRGPHLPWRAVPGPRPPWGLARGQVRSYKWRARPMRAGAIEPARLHCPVVAGQVRSHENSLRSPIPRSGRAARSMLT